MRMLTETLANRTWPGVYGQTGASRLVRRGDRYYLVHDHFCGLDHIEGGALRAHVYEVPAGRVEEIGRLFAAADEFVAPDRPELGTNWGYLCQHVLAELVSHGRQGSLRWTRCL